jgi:branched-chain amino acid transport system permease protein
MIGKMLKAGLWQAGALIVLATPILGSASAVDFMFRMCSLIVLAVSWNMMASAGLISLGHSAFFGLGAYVGILSANLLGLPFAVTLLGALVAGALLGAGLALITGRMRGIYFAITTLAASEGLRVIAVMVPDLTGGSKGAYLQAAASPGPLTVNLAMSLAACLMCLIAWLLSRTRYHFAFRAMRANEAASQMLGIFPLKFRTGIMALCGAMASLVGGIEAWHGGYLDPATAFDLHNTITSQIAPILGGIYTLAGPVIGAIATVALGDATRLALGHVEGASLLVFGIVLMACVLFLPEGINGAVARLMRRRSRRPDEVAAAVRP